MSTTAILSVDDYVKLPAVPPTSRYHYGEDSEQFADLYLPPTPPQNATGYRVIVLIHGGCWRAQYTLAPLGQFCRTFADLGVAVWSLEYRRIGNGGGWPTTFLDVAAGADYLHSVADTHQLNLNNVVAVGHSAGGHLALWLAARRRLQVDSPLFTPDPLALVGVVALAGIPDLVDAATVDICRGAVPELLDGTPEQVPNRYRDGSPSVHLPLGLPQHLIIGLEDQAVPTAHNERYQEQASAAGDTVELTLLPETGHFEIVTPGTAVWPVVQNAILEQLK